MAWERMVLVSLERKLEGEGPWESPVGGERRVAWRKGPAFPPGSSKGQPQGQVLGALFISYICSIHLQKIGPDSRLRPCLLKSVFLVPPRELNQ